ncbi:MAG: AAA family ATPase [Desulfovibrio sp.]|nr:AAA family ATPase [Desulfovibrio sp.]
MPNVAPLPKTRLHAQCDPSRIPWEDSTKIPLSKNDLGREISFQPRAMQALDLAVQINTPGYNIYVSGNSGLGRTHTVMNYLRPLAKKAPVPDDVIYVYNFKNPDSPRLFTLPAGTASKIKPLLQESIQKISKKLFGRYDDAAYLKKHATLLDDFQSERVGLLQKMNSMAHKKGFHIDFDDSGTMTLSPVQNGKNSEQQDVDKIEETLKKDLYKNGSGLMQKMAGMMRQLARAEESFHADERDLDRLIMEDVLDAVFNPVIEKIFKLCHSEPFKEYLFRMRDDMLKNTECFMSSRDAPSSLDPRGAPADDVLSHYEINLFVDNSSCHGCPILVDEHPTAANLLGCVEREAELGTLVTNFSLIRAGSLQKANGGYLVLRMEDLMQYPNAWEGLLRSLRANEVRIEDTDDGSDSTIRTKGISPEALPLNIKIILIGSEQVYEFLIENDERFQKLFRIKAHMAVDCVRNSANIRRYLTHIARIIQGDGLLPFDRNGLAWLVDHGCHMSEDQKRLSLRFPILREFMIEANALALERKCTMVDSQTLEDAYTSRIYRANLVEEVFLDEYDREMIKVQTKGSAIGQVNGLSVTDYGDFEFGLPHRISCTVGVGQDGIIDLEREAELGGPIHTKAMMILKSFLIHHFAAKKPLVLAGSLYFEQNYAGIEGDSASGAELAALLSALAEVPIRLDLAFTGAVSHTGQILPVGGVTRKIEGFYKVCAHHGGLTGTQGVIIPKDNIDHLMLSPFVLDAVEQKTFFIYPVQTIEEALLLLTGLEAGRSLKHGGYTRNSLYDRVDRRLQFLGECSQNAFHRTSRRKDDNR